MNRGSVGVCAMQMNSVALDRRPCLPPCHGGDREGSLCSLFGVRHRSRNSPSEGRYFLSFILLDLS